MLRLTVAIVDENQELAIRKTYGEKHKRNLRPHRQVEQTQTVEWDRRNAVGCSHTIQADEIFDAMALEPFAGVLEVGDDSLSGRSQFPCIPKCLGSFFRGFD